jgi:hypothetical protein
VILNFEKAFNKVSHQRLLRKLQGDCIQNPLLINVVGILFLTERFQKAMCEEEAEVLTPVAVTSWLPRRQFRASNIPFLQLMIGQAYEAEIYF